MKLEFQQAPENLFVEFDPDARRFVCKVLGETLQGEVLDWAPPFFSIKTPHEILHGAFFRGKDFIDVHLPSGNYRLRYAKKLRVGHLEHVGGGLVSPMPGKVIKVLVKSGAKVKKGDLLMILEAMKMEHKIVSPQDGVVKKVFFKEGERVAQEVDLLEIK